MHWKTKLLHHSGIVPLLILTSQLTHAQTPTPVENPYLAPQRRMVLTQKSAFVLGDAEKVSGTFVSTVLPSPEGRYALIVRRAVNPAFPAANPQADTINFLVWDSQTRKVRPLWSFEGIASEAVRKLQWFKGTSVLLMDLPYRIPGPDQQPKRSRALYVVDLARLRMRVVGTPTDLLRYNDSGVASPTQPRIALIDLNIIPGGKQGSTTIVRGGLCLIDSSGELRVVAFPSGSTLYRTQPWSPDGRQVYLEDNSSKPAQYFAVDSVSGTIQPLAAKPEAPSVPPVSEASMGLTLTVAHGDGLLKSGQTALPINPIWLEGDTESPAPRALIEADADQNGSTVLLPDSSAVLFRKNGALYALPLQRFERSAFLAQHRKALQEVTMAQAKKIFQALMSYTADHDGKLPTSDSPLTDTLGRYTDAAGLNDPTTGKTDLLFPDPGANLLSLSQNPAQAGLTVLGSLQGSGGRAVIWADGHITWVDTP